MEDVERFFRHLVRVLSEGDRDRSREPIEVAEIYQSILPYRHFRNVLEFETNQDYEMALLRLLAGHGGLASVDPIEAQEALSEEASSVNPNPAAYRDYAAAKVYLNVNAVHTVSDSRDPYAPPMAEQATERATESSKPAVASLPFMPETPPDVTPPAGLERGSMFAGVGARPASCPSCSRGLPAKRLVKFCPYCGSDISVRRCKSCGADMGRDWSFCVECGSNAPA